MPCRSPARPPNRVSLRYGWSGGGAGWHSKLFADANSAPNLIRYQFDPLTNRDRAVGLQGVKYQKPIKWRVGVGHPSGQRLNGVAAFGSQFVLTGDLGTVLTSGNGTNWTRRTTPTAAFLSGVTAHPGGLVAVGKGGAIITSPDGTNWTQRTTGTTNWIIVCATSAES